MAAELIELLPIEQYHSHRRHLTKTLLTKLAKNPALFKFVWDGGDERSETKKKLFGAAAHVYIMERPEFNKRYHVMPNINRDMRHQAYRDEVAAAAGKPIVKEQDLDELKEIGEQVQRNALAIAALDCDGEVPLIESTIRWTDPLEIDLQTRPDYLFPKKRRAVDIKISESAEPEEFRRTAWKLHYDISVAMTAQGFKALTGEELNDYLFMVIEKKPPYVIQVFSAFKLFDGKLNYHGLGRIRLHRLLALYEKCLEEDRWPSYSSEIEAMSVPDWALKQLNREIEQELYDAT